VSAVVAIGSSRRLQGFALAGVDVRPAESPDDVPAAWAALGADVGLLILTPEAAAVLEDVRAERQDVVWVTLSE